MKNQYTLVVKLGSQIKIAQYGKEDGNPAFAGMDILNFLKSNSMEQFKNRVRPLGVLSQTEVDIARSRKLPIWTMGAQVLEEVMTGRIENVFLDLVFIDSMFCDWSYIIDLDTHRFFVGHGANAAYSLRQLPSMDVFLRDCGDEYDMS